MGTLNKEHQQLENNQKKQQAPLINEAIRFRTMMVIDDNGNNLGEMSRLEALNLASSKNLDLVVIAKKGNIPVTKILDYGKYKYEQKRRQKETKKNQTIIKVKEIKVKPTIGNHDLMVRVNNAKKWLVEYRDNVKFVIEARGRLSTKDDMIEEVYLRFVDLIKEFGVVVQQNKKVSAFRYETLIEPLKNN